MKKQCTVMVLNTFTNKYEEVTVTPEVEIVFKRTEWNIKDNDASFYKHEIQISSLIGGEYDACENINGFVDAENTPENLVVKKLELEALNHILITLSDSEAALMQALFRDGLTEREYAKELGVYQYVIHKKKLRILNKIKNFLKI